MYFNLLNLSSHLQLFMDSKKGKICIFTGAGISVPLGLPMTNGFESTLKKMPPEVQELVNGHLKEYAQDIEKVLYNLEDFVKADNMISHLLLKSSNTSPYNQFTSHVDNLKYHAKESIKIIKTDIYKLLASKDPNLAFKLYSSIINEISSFYPSSSFSFFTTNYDCTFETGMLDNINDLEEQGITDINYGFSGGRHGKNLFNPKDDFGWSKNVIEYYKLHGSLDWTHDRYGNCIRSGTDLDPADPAAMPLLYPGFKGTPTKEPFISIHERLYQRLNEVKVVFVLGFAFRDPYINNLFEFAMRTNKELKVLCFNPAEDSQIPPDSELQNFAERYKNNFFRIKTKIEVSETPLKLVELFQANKNLRPKGESSENYEVA